MKKNGDKELKSHKSKTVDEEAGHFDFVGKISLFGGISLVLVLSRLMAFLAIRGIS